MKSKFVVVLAVLLLTGCSSFQSEWKTALTQPRETSDISGAWEGKWLSDKNGHTGKLRAILKKSDADHYDAHFHATFWKILRATYRVPLRYDEQNGVYTLSGESNLGRLAGGAYTYQAEATPTRFFSTYKSKYDHGTFEMERPKWTTTTEADSAKAEPAEPLVQ